MKGLFIACLLCLALLFAAPAPAQTKKPKKPVYLCPVSAAPMPNLRRKTYRDYRGKRYYFCCVSCKAQFVRDPARFVKGL